MNGKPFLAKTYKPGEPVNLNKEETCFKVRTGSVIIHIVEITGGTPGRRLSGHLFGSGSTLFGLTSESLSLLIVPRTDVTIEETGIKDLKDEQDDLVSAYGRWVHHPLFTGKVQGRTQNITRLQPGINRAASGNAFRAEMEDREMLLCRVIEGAAKDFISDTVFTPDEGFFPVNPDTVLITENDSVIEVSSSPDYEQEIDLPLYFQTCRQWARQRMHARWADNQKSEEERFSAWMTQESKLRECIIKKTPEAGRNEDSLWPVFTRVLKEIGVKPKDPGTFDSQISENCDVFTSISLMAEHSGVRIRRVRLLDSWWKKDNGPLLVVKNDTFLLAAIQKKPNHYDLYDAKGIRVRHERIAETVISPMAYMLYPPFPDRELNLSDILRFIFGSVWKRDLGFLVIFGMLVGVLATAVPVAIGILFNNAIPYADYELFQAVIIVLLLSTIASAIFQIGREIALLRLEGRIGGVLEAAVWDRMLKLPAAFFRNYNAGNLASRAGIVDGIRQLLSGVTITVIFGAVFSIFNVLLMFAISVDLALKVVSFVALVFIITVVIGYLSLSPRRELLALQGHLSGITFQMLSGIVKISSAGAENRAYLRWEKEFRKQIALKLRIGSYDVYSRVFTVLWPGMLTIIVFAITGYSMALPHPDISNGWFLAFYSAVGAFSAAFASLGDAFITVCNIKPMWDWMSPVLTTKIEVEEGHIHPGTLTGALELSHINFRHTQEGPLVLTDISLEVHPGEFVAIIGPSGSGKSTLLRILLGFEKPDSGAVLYDGQSLAQLNVREVRKQIGVVLQDGQLMADSIFNNIAGSRSLSMDEAWDAARLAGLESDIRQMPMGMYTYINEGSANISGGQKQRVLIARAIASRPRMILFDEATSALDNASQKIVSNSLYDLRLTRVIIAHRLSSIEAADCIYVLDSGRIVESGKYDELMAKGGVFSRLAQRQLVD